jgi:hypothetical protein
MDAGIQSQGCIYVYAILGFWIAAIPAAMTYLIYPIYSSRLCFISVMSSKMRCSLAMTLATNCSGGKCSKSWAVLGFF